MNEETKAIWDEVMASVTLKDQQEDELNLPQLMEMYGYNLDKTRDLAEKLVRLGKLTKRHGNSNGRTRTLYKLVK